MFLLVIWKTLVQLMIYYLYSKHNASFIVVIYDNNIDEVKLKEKLGDEVIYLSKSKLDEYWLSIIKIWYLGIGDEELWRFK